MNEPDEDSPVPAAPPAEGQRQYEVPPHTKRRNGSPMFRSHFDPARATTAKGISGMEAPDPHEQRSSSGWAESLVDASRLVAGLGFAIAGHTSHRLANAFLNKL